MSTLGALYGHSKNSSSSIKKEASPSSSSSSSSSSSPATRNQASNTTSADPSPANTTALSSNAAPVQAPRPKVPRQSILISGLRRSGKTSILKVVHDRLSPNDTLFLDSTTKANSKLVDSFNPIRFWDLPGSNQSYTFPLPNPSNSRSANNASSAQNSNSNSLSFEAAASPPDYHQISAVIFVIDSQDDYFDSLSVLHETILKVHRVNRKCQFHVFIHKVDGLSDDYKWDTQRDIEQRIFDDLSDASGSFLYSDPPKEADSNTQSSSHLSREPRNVSPNHSSSTSQFSQVNLETSVPLTFHLTSIFDSSVFIAFSRVQSALIDSGLADAVEGVCTSLCTSCTFDKVMLLDVPSRTYIGLDAGPFDAGSFDVASEYVSFLGEMSSLYSNLPRRKPDTIERGEPIATESLPPNALIDKGPPQASLKSDQDEEEEIENQGKYASSCARLNPDTTVGFWQMNNHLALVATLRTEAYQKQAGLIDYNVTFFRRAVQQLYEMAQYGGNQ